MDWRAIGRQYEAGVWAVPLALFPAFLLSAAFGQPSCLEPVVGLIITYIPIVLAHALLTLLGPFARPLALIGAIALLMPLAGLLGIVAPPITEDRTIHPGRWRWLPVVAIALGAAALLGGFASNSLSALTAFVAGLFFPLCLVWTRTWRRPAPHLAGRRKLVRSLLGTPLVTFGLLALSSYELWSVLAIKTFSLGNPVQRLFAFVAPKPRRPEFPVAGLEPEVTPVSAFYINSKNTTDPLQLAEDWLLQVSGQVRNPLTLTYQQLLAMPRTDLYVTMRCVDNPIDGHLMSTALWSGVRLAEILKQAQPLSTATTLVFHAADRFAETLDLGELSPESALLAYAMNGTTLTQAHGAPVRGLWPGWYGFKNIKWLQGLEVTASPVQGYWARAGWTATKIHPLARIDVARFLDGEQILVAGVAFGGLRGLSAVQVRVNAGPWQLAELNAPPLSAYTWVQWRAVVPAATSRVRLTARMIDGAGMLQDERSYPVYPGGASGLHTIEVQR